MPDLIAKDHQEKDCDSDNPGSLPKRVVATTAYVAVKGRAIWHQSLQRQLTGCHCCGNSKVEYEEGWAQPCQPFQPRQPCALYTQSYLGARFLGIHYMTRVPHLALLLCDCLLTDDRSPADCDSGQAVCRT
jgi:hypothetical protein